MDSALLRDSNTRAMNAPDFPVDTPSGTRKENEMGIKIQKDSAMLEGGSTVVVRSMETPRGKVSMFSIAGRPQKNDWQRTARSTLLLVTRGEGHIMSAEGEQHIQSGDVVAIPPQTEYAFVTALWGGRMELVGIEM